MTSSNALAAIAQVIVLVILGLIAAIAPKARAWLDAHTTESTRKLLGDAVKIAINATEQAVRDGAVQGDSNTDRLTYAVNVVKRYADLWGIQIESAVIGPLIEAMLYREENYIKPDKPKKPMTVPGGQSRIAQPSMYATRQAGTSWAPVSSVFNDLVSDAFLADAIRDLNAAYLRPTFNWMPRTAPATGVPSTPVSMQPDEAGE